MSQRESTVEARVEELLGLLAASATLDYIGEDLSQLEHALQCAALAQQEEAREEQVIAALLHDLGHYCAPPDAAQMGGYGVADHEEIGALALRDYGFSETVQELVRGHVQAKRYLVTTQEGYADKVSHASQETLKRQGGGMSPEEVASFEGDPLFREKLRLRWWDDAGKVEDLLVPPLESYRSLLTAHLQRSLAEPTALLSEAQRQRFAAEGFLHLPGFLDGEAAAELRRWTEELQEWPETPGQWMKYFETVGGARQLCRVENFLPYHHGLRELLVDSDLNVILGELMGEPATLYKEKLNFKLPGGAGFGAHQDAPAFTTFGQTYHITVMISVDPTTRENGCLEMVPGVYGTETLAQGPDGTLAPSLVEAYPWEALETAPGDVVLFHSYIPHRSGENRTQAPRRALYITYNRASEGDRRDDYYAHKREHFPPECERVEGRDYSAAEALYNLGNPIRK